MAIDATNAIATTATNTAGMRFICVPPDRGVDSVEHPPSIGRSTWGLGPPYGEKQAGERPGAPGADRERRPRAHTRVVRAPRGSARAAERREAGMDSPGSCAT